MKSKIIFIALAMTFGTALAAHADEYQRPHRPAPQQDYDDGDLDEDYRRPSNECDPCRVQRERPRQEYYCNQPRCQAPEVLPYPVPVQRPIFVPVPVPRPIGGACSVVPRFYGGGAGWAIVVNGGIEVARGMRFEAPNIPILKQQLLWNGVCTVFLN